MVNIVIENVEQFKTFFNVIYEEATELLELQLHPDRMVCTVLDRTRTRFFHIEYESRFFSLYSVDDVDSIVVFVEDFHTLLKSVNKTDVLHLEINAPYLMAKIESSNGNCRVFEFVLPTEYIVSPVPPHAEFPSVFECDVGDLKQSIKDIGLIGSDLVIFNVINDELNITTSDDIATKYANQILVDFDKSANGASGFTLDYVAQMLKFDKISKTVKLKLGSDMPVFYTFADEMMGVRASGMIAPRISEE